MSLDDIVKMDGVIFAFDYTASGHCTGYRAQPQLDDQAAGIAADYAATVTKLFETLARSFSSMSEMQMMPARGWTFSGGDWMIIAGNSRAVFVEPDRADVNKLMEMLMEMLMGVKTKCEVSQAV